MADLNLGTYSPEDMIAIISGTTPDGAYTHALSGWAEGTFITVERTTASSAFVQGATSNGNGRIFRSHKMATISYSILQFSSDNDVLSAIWKLDSEARDSSMMFNMILVDGTGRSVFHCNQCYIENMPSATFGSESESRTWVIHALQLDEYIGGNAKVPTDIQNTLAKLGVNLAARWI